MLVVGVVFDFWLVGVGRVRKLADGPSGEGGTSVSELDDRCPECGRRAVHRWAVGRRGLERLLHEEDCPVLIDALMELEED